VPVQSARRARDACSLTERKVEAPIRLSGERPGIAEMYGVPYMSVQLAPPFELTLRGFSPRELRARAEERCASHFAQCPFRVDEVRCVPCVCSIGGRVRLYEARIVARALPEQGQTA
jgi:hypothetical protein